jgi:hypothetical protein
MEAVTVHFALAVFVSFSKKNYFFLPVSGFFVVVAITQIHISKVCLGGHT